MGKKLLVVDDSRFTVEELRALVAPLDLEITWAKTGEEAIELYETLQPDLVTMDIIMPGMDGMEATREIRRRWPDSKVLVLSSLAYDESIREAQECGACDFLAKPFDPAQTLEALRKHLAL